LRAERKIGEFTKEIPAVVGIEPLRSVKEYPDDTLSERVTKEQILRDNKISKVQASKWERIAGIPSIDFEFEITKDDVSTEHLLTYAKDPNKANEKRKQKQTRKREQKQTQTAKDKARTFNFQERVRMAEEHTVKLKQKPKPKFTEQPGFGQRAEWYQLMSRLATALEKVVGVVSKQEDIVTELLMTGRLLGMKSSRGLDHELKRIHKCLDKLRPLFSVMKKLEDEDDADNFKGDTIDGEVIH
jgi:transcriptional regulator with XRE-family HTH domain